MAENNKSVKIVIISHPDFQKKNGRKQATFISYNSPASVRVACDLLYMLNNSTRVQIIYVKSKSENVLRT